MFLINYLTQEIYFYENDYTPTDWDALRSLAGVSEGTMTRLKVQKAEPLLLEYIDVIKSITSDTLPTVTGEDGLAVLQVVQQLCASVAPQVMRAGEAVKGTEVEV